jgi:hypothetical protein
MTTLCPSAARVDAVAAPTPLLPPVTMTFSRRSSSVSDSQAVDSGEVIDLEDNVRATAAGRLVPGHRQHVPATLDLGRRRVS